MNAMLFQSNSEKPVAVLDEVTVVEMNDNHKSSPLRITYKSHKLNASSTMIELHRNDKLHVKLEDGRSGSVLLQHNSLDMEGNAVGVLRVLGELSAAPAAAVTPASA
jgi:hypothetical protein